MAFTAVGAVLAGTADVATVATAVAEVGTAMSVVGAVTGNSTLTKVGGVMGLAGGVTALASGAMSAGADIATQQSITGAVDTGEKASEFSGVQTDANGNVLSSPQTSASYNDLTGTVTNPDGSTIGLPSSGTGSTGDLGANQFSSFGSNSSSGGSGGVGGLDQSNASPSDNSLIGGQNTTTTSPSTGAPSTQQNAGTGGSPLSASPTPAINQATPSNPQYQAFQGGTTTQVPTSGASQAASQVNNVPVSQMMGQSANLPAGMPAATSPGGNYNDAAGQYTSPNGDTIKVGPNAEELMNQNQNKDNEGLFSGLTNWVNNNPNAARFYGQIGTGALSGLASAYQTAKQNQINEGMLNIANEKQNNSNAQVAQSGIISSARKKQGS